MPHIGHVVVESHWHSLKLWIATSSHREIDSGLGQLQKPKSIAQLHESEKSLFSLCYAEEELET